MTCGAIIIIIKIRKQFVCSALEGTQGYSGTVTPIVSDVRFDTQEPVFPADSYIFIWEQHNKNSLLYCYNYPYQLKTGFTIYLK